MGRFTEDMGRLRDDIESSRVARHQLVADTREEVTAAAHAFIDDLRNTVMDLQTNMREAHAEMAEAGRADRAAFISRLGGTVASIRAAAARRQVTVREALAESAAKARAERAEAISTLRDDVEEMQEGFRRAHGEMAVEVRAADHAFVSSIVGAVNGLQRQTMQLVGNMAAERGTARMAWRTGAPKAAERGTARMALRTGAPKAAEPPPPARPAPWAEPAARAAPKPIPKAKAADKGQPSEPPKAEAPARQPDEGSAS